MEWIHLLLFAIKNIKVKVFRLCLCMNGQMFLDSFRFSYNCCLSLIVLKRDIVWGRMMGTVSREYICACQRVAGERDEMLDLQTLSFSESGQESSITTEGMETLIKVVYQCLESTEHLGGNKRPTNCSWEAAQITTTQFKISVCAICR